MPHTRGDDGSLEKLCASTRASTQQQVPRTILALCGSAHVLLAGFPTCEEPQCSPSVLLFFLSENSVAHTF